MTSGHYWLPVAEEVGGVRHAFRGRRWEGRSADEAVCGRTVPMAQPSEMDWITFKSCRDCRHSLLSEAGIQPEVVHADRSSKSSQ
ncbi:hypothetical protein A8924_5999 [Saccharopolyspora erythraea NRRL 2338]|uniref:Uncharacterized protein n=1 Tax=Saccharopolyspora erythraea TaxID=1836 RepID=A0ABN1DNE3_SACER|nr:hypothetical protein A8924_5999 [Saccharopolyspora erythraea NRRL 2338]